MPDIPDLRFSVRTAISGQMPTRPFTQENRNPGSPKDKDRFVDRALTTVDEDQG